MKVVWKFVGCESLSILLTDSMKDGHLRFSVV